MDLQNTKVSEVTLSYKTTVKASERPTAPLFNLEGYDIFKVLM